MTDSVESVARAFAALAQGDLSHFSPGYTHLGYDINGRPRIFDGLGPFVEMMATCAQTFDVFEAETVSATAIDDELVLASVAVHRRTKAGQEYHGTIAMTFRVEHGIVTRGTDMVSSAGEAYWSSLGL